MAAQDMREMIKNGSTALGIELGSTRIKAVLIGPDHSPLASGSHDWENKLENGIWTYSLEAIWTGIQDCYVDLKRNVKDKYDIELETVGSMGVSAMMHGYMAFDEAEELLVPFRTWRNTITAQASEKLVPLFNYPVPHRWSIAHLYQAILNGEAHVERISFITTLAGYVHRCLSGEKVLGIGDASGMFPIDIKEKRFHKNMIAKFDELIENEKFNWTLESILPTVLIAGESAGALTKEGARLLDISGMLKSGIPLCPPEGDAGTGMTATNSISPRTGNVSAGTSIFLMAVLERNLETLHPELDLVTTPAGDLVAMVHCNNCTGDIDAWIKVFAEVMELAGIKMDKSELYKSLYFKALEGEADCGGLLSYNYISGESITELEKGRPLFLRMPDSEMNLANFMRDKLYSALATLKIGFDILRLEENVTLDRVYGHGGFFKTEHVGQQMMAAAIDTPVTLMETAGEGGPWGMAILAAYMKNKTRNESLRDYLSNHVFSGVSEISLDPNPEDVKGFDSYMERYRACLTVEEKAAEFL